MQRSTATLNFVQACNVQNLIPAVPAAALRADLHGFAVTLARYIAKFRPSIFFFADAVKTYNS